MRPTAPENFDGDATTDRLDPTWEVQVDLLYPTRRSTLNSNHYYLRNRWSYRLQIWSDPSHGPSEPKPFKMFGEKEAWAYPGTAQIFAVPPVVSGIGKATNFKFCTHIHSIQSEEKPIKNFRKSSHRHSQGLPKILRALICRAHHAVIFAIARLSCKPWIWHLCLSDYCTHMCSMYCSSAACGIV